MNSDRHERWLRSAFLVLHLVVGASLLIDSSLTSLRSTAHANWPLTAFASTEALGALLFLIPRTMRIGGFLLLGALLLAFGIHAAGLELELQLLVGAAAVAFVMVHGSVHRHRESAATWSFANAQRSGPTA